MQHAAFSQRYTTSGTSTSLFTPEEWNSLMIAFHKAPKDWFYFLLPYESIKSLENNNQKLPKTVKTFHSYFLNDSYW